MKRSVHPEGRGRREAAGESNVIAEFDASPTVPATQSPRLAVSYAWGLDLSGTETGAGGLLFAKLHSAPGAPVLAPCYDGTQGDWRESRETNRRFARQGETSARRERVNCSGNILAYVDCAAGQALARYEYDPFGKLLLKDEDTRVAGRLHHQFSTKYCDAETGLAYYGYRYYSPELGRWVNRDPMTEHGFATLSRGLPKARSWRLATEHATAYLFACNAPVDVHDVHGLWVAYVVAGAAAVGGLCAYDCWAEMRQTYLAATEIAERETGEEAELYGSSADALKHCIGACNVTQDAPLGCITTGIAQGLLQAREVDGTMDGVIDEKNNAVGFDFGKSGGNCEEKCKQAFGERKLYSYDPAATNDPNQIKPTAEDQFPTGGGIQ